MITTQMLMLAQAAQRSADDLSITWFEVAVAASLLAINAVVSLVLKLGLARQILISSIRMTVQLAILGLVLKQIFDLSEPAPVLALAALMTLVAGISAVRRIDSRFPSIYVTAVFSVWASTWLVTAVTVLMIVRPEPWYRPPVLIPLLGMCWGTRSPGYRLVWSVFWRSFVTVGAKSSCC